MWIRTWSDVILMKSKKLGSSRLICLDTNPASWSFWPYHCGPVTAFHTALSSPYSLLIYPTSLGATRCQGGTGVIVSNLCGRRVASTGNTWCQQPPSMSSLKLPGKAPALRWWPKAARASPKTPAAQAAVPLPPQAWWTLPNLSDISSTQGPLWGGVIYQMSKLLVPQRNLQCKLIQEKPTLCPQSQSEPASFPQQQMQFLQHAAAFWQCPTSCQSPDSDPGKAHWEGGCCATWLQRSISQDSTPRLKHALMTGPVHFSARSHLFP